MHEKISNIVGRMGTGIGREAIFVLFIIALPVVTLMALVYPPTIVSQGQAHRIFYIHVPIAWVALYAPLFSAVCGVIFLITGKERFDVWSLANARIAFLFALGVVISGPLWASTEWGTYWNWKDSRLMSFFILLLCLGGYFLVRFLTDDPRSRSRYSAMMALLAALAALLTWFAIRLIQPDTHPTSVLGTMSPRIRITFWVSVLGYHLFFWALLRLTIRQEYMRRVLEEAVAESS